MMGENMGLDIEKNCSRLEAIAKNYAPESDEYKALQLAGLAMHYVWDKQVREKFQQWIDSMDGGLSEKQKEHLRSMGINPDNGCGK